MNQQLSFITCTILVCLGTLNAEENSVVISKTIKEKQEYKIGEIIELTKNEYRNKDFTNFFKKN